MNLFDSLRQHASREPDSIATESPRHRLTTYRKLWSRIERGSARCQHEWLVEPGDIVIYAGHAHADALVLWLSLARLGAALLPVETPALLERLPAIADRAGARLLLHDDDMSLALPDDHCASHPLSTLISTPCEQDALDCPENEDSTSLLHLERTPAGQVARHLSLTQLRQAQRQIIWQPDGPLFEPGRLAGQVLPALLLGQPLHLA